METQNNQTSNDEISLIDLLVVIIRQRVLIIGGTFIVAALALLILWGVPRIKGNSVAPKNSIEMTLYFDTIPRILTDYVTYPIMKSYGRALKDKEVIKKIYSKQASLDSKALETVIPNIMVSINEAESQITVGYSFFHTNVVVEKEFLSALNEYAFLQTQTYLRNLFQKQIEVSEKTLSKKTASRVNGATEIELLELVKIINQATILTENNLFPLLEPATFSETLPEKASNKKKYLLIITFASAMMFVFLAFVIEAVKKVKENPIDREKLMKAWRKES